MRRRRVSAEAATAVVVTGFAAAGAAAAFELQRRRGLRAQTADGRVIVRWLLEEPWKGNWDVVRRHVSTSYLGHDVAEGAPALGPEGFRSRIERYLAAFPDGAIAVDEQIPAGAHVTTRWTFTGTNTGELDGLPATGRQVNVSGLTTSRLSGATVIEQWTSWDRLGLLVQLGAVSEPAHA
jgi:predicted ester cyclase